ncbi:phage tail tip protein J-related protein [Aeromonas veronii]|uniref:phage tail tip protein J-related protein n=1 Tax=Aeromonas veronii TaxID=654 RepID=UPI003DA610EF
MVRALALTGAASPVAAVNFVISAPATPIGVEVEAGNWTLAFRPKFAGGDGYGVLCEWWVSTINLPIGEVMEKARAAGMGTYMQFGQLKPDTTYYVWLRAVNAYGKSALLAASGKTTYDASSILDIIDGEIGAEHLREELREPIELIPDLADQQVKLGASVDELTKIVVGDEQSVVSRLDTISASVDLAAEGAIGAALAGAEESDRQRRATGQIRREQVVIVDQQKALASELTEFKTEFAGELATTNAALQESSKAFSDAGKALGEKIDTVQALVSKQGKELSAAVQTVASAVASLDGEVEAGWYTKAQINGEGGGFGLSVTLNPDGSVLSSFIVDADVFAIMSRASGESSRRHPFVVKNGSVYMNHALMDTAEIGNVIAKYINVQHLIGSLIEGGSFRGGDIWLGENPNGAFSAYGKRWNAGIDSNGQFFGSNVYFDGGTFKGNVQANSGTMNNVVIREDCTVLATLYADKIVGDVCKVVSTFNSGHVLTFEAYNRRRSVVITIPSIRAHMKIPYFTLRVGLKVYFNGSAVYNNPAYTGGSYSIQNGADIGEKYGFQMQFELPSNVTGTVSFVMDISTSPPGPGPGDYDVTVIAPLIAMAFIQ